MDLPLGDDWKKLPDVKAQGGSWKELPDVSAGADTGVPGSPLEQALRQQQGDVVTVPTPTGPTQFTRKGERFYPPGDPDMANNFAGGAAKAKERTLQGLLSFFSGGGPLIDEMRGLDAGARATLRGEMSPLEAYRQVRYQTRNDVSEATSRASPVVSVGGVQIPVLPALGAAVTNLLVPNPSSIMGRIALGAEQGAQQALSEDESDLTRGEYGPAARALLRGGGSGALVTGAMEPVGAGISKLTRGAGELVGDIVNTRAAKDATDVAGEVATLRGQLGGESQKASRLFENTQRAMAGTPLNVTSGVPIKPNIQQRAMLALSDPAAARLQEKVLERGIGELPGQTQKVMGLEHDLAEKVALAGDEAAGRTADYFKPSAWEADIRPRVVRQIGNASIGATAGIPASVAMMASGMSPGRALTAGIGSGATLGLSKGAITSARNALSSPRVQASALQQFIEEATGASGGLQTAARAGGQAGREGGSLSDEEKASISAFSTYGF